MKTSTLQHRNHQLAQKELQRHILENTLTHIPAFDLTIVENGVENIRASHLDIFQINLGYLCNMTCEHCHVDAGPTRREIMTRTTLMQCIKAIKDSKAKTIDLTGGAPEMNPDFKWFVKEIRSIETVEEIIVRSNLTILVSNDTYASYIPFFKENKLTVIASLPCYTAENTDKQRGDKAFERSILAIRRLNEIGYGEDSSLQLHLVYNPGGAFLPGDQEKLSLAYKKRLYDDHGIHFNNLYTITNLPISRFLDYLMQEEKLDTYMSLLLDSFNVAALNGVMCKNTLSVSWDGFLYDCDFNQMLDLKIKDKRHQHISEFNVNKLFNRSIVTGNHCYGCTAGAGSSCQGSLT